jgi:hypothetical protein
MKDFLVIPDAYNGGADLVHVAHARTALEACELVRDHIMGDMQSPDKDDSVAIAGFKYASEQDAKANPYGVWIVREWPDKRPTPGVRDWHEFNATYWRAVEKSCDSATSTGQQTTNTYVAAA